MGLLDEAIREHLELKRRRGADPSAIAREEREALAPVLTDDSAGDDGDLAHDGPEAAGIPPADPVPAQERSSEDDRLAGLSAVGQETAELDMQAVMEEDPDAADSASPVGPIVDGPTPAPYSGETPAEDGLDWEFPSEREREAVAEDVPGQERLRFE
ncbi:MAG: hypothetical protein ACLQBY_16890 [Solirubrobacteraceae bacterium]